MNTRIRIGSRVQVTTPSFVARVGYPKQVEDYLPLVDTHDEALEAYMAGVLSIKPYTLHELLRAKQGNASENKAARRIKHELAHLLAAANGFGGRERSIHWLEVPELKGSTGLVRNMKTVVTGTYFPGFQGHSYYGEDEDNEPADLHNRVSHRLAKVELPYKEPLWCPVYHLKLVEVVR